MRVHFVRAFALVCGLILAGPAAAQSYAVPDPWPPTVDPSVIGYPAGYSTNGSYEGDDYYKTSDREPLTSQTSTACGDCGCWDCPEFCATCDGCPSRGIVLFSGIDSWRGIADRAGSFNSAGNNEGGSFGLNFGTSLGRVSEMTGIGFQFGASYGVYDWNGRPFNSGVLTTSAAQQQVFVTTGFFKKADEVSALSYGVVHDWMANQAFGTFAVNPTLGQWRAQVAYATSAWNEFGAWGTWRDRGATSLNSGGNPIRFRAINQIDFFWHHKWACLADSWIWVGVPQDSRLSFQGGNLGDLLIGGSVIAPLGDVVSLYANMQYMHPSAAPGNAAFGEASWYVAFGLQFYIGGNARTNTVGGNCWLPYLPMANNGNFLVDSAVPPPA